MPLDLTTCVSKHGNYIMLYSACDMDIILHQNSGWYPAKNGYARFNNTNEFVHLAIAKRMGITSILTNHIDSNRGNNQRSNLEESDHSHNNLAINRINRPIDKREVLIDKEDFEVFLLYGWRIDGGYIRLIRKPYENVRLHRLIAFRAGMIKSIDDPRDIDHEDQDPFNNYRYNLRAVSKSVNGSNALYIRSKCGYFGVYQRGYKYQAEIGNNSNYKSLGTYECAVEAALAYDKEAIQRYGPTFKYLNFKLEDLKDAV